MSRKMTKTEYDEEVRLLAAEHLAWGGSPTKVKHVDDIERELRRWGSADDYDTMITASGYDYDRVIADVAKAIHGFISEPQEIRLELESLGFGLTNTGGGHEAYIIEVDPGSDYPHFLITDSDGLAPPDSWDQEAMLGYYADADDEGDVHVFDTARDLVRALKHGPSPFAEWKAGSLRIPDADLEVINRHRASLGMKPIDMAAGWSTDELRDMADSIRTTGRMNNPRSLKRKLMR